MKFKSLLFLLLTSLISSVLAELSHSGSHARGSILVVRADAKTTKKKGGGKKPPPSSSKNIGPEIPEGKDKTKLHVWVRVEPLGELYDNRHGIDHQGMNNLMIQIGGKHCDVVVGNPSQGFRQLGLLIDEADWMKKKPNGDGATVKVENSAYKKVPDETIQYKGQAAKKVSTLNKAKQIADGVAEGLTYDHQNFNCKTFADQLVAELGATP
ncbi:hypothetical protein MFIFM68171_01137 [Madurella fahalii]|uniref:Uncharacterized protein n=1 Tax=Madurella fahalii TaxID=1157608 RepID=A0ABQ0FZJ6_9PEZI